MGLALACIIKGYKLICTMPDKQSKEKMDILRAVGAEVIVTPTNVSADDPRSYYSVARRLSQEIPNSYYPNQYDNLSNTVANYEQTGPEIWEQTDGKITHLVVGVGTGGTISGTGKYLKEKNPNIKIWGIDTYGSVFKKYKETGIFDENEIYSYLTEGIGEDILPKNVDFNVIDRFEKVTDKDGMLMTREIARQEGIFAGNSPGCAVKGLLQLKDELKPDDVVVVIFHDHGSRYIGKIFNDDWMRDRGFLAKEAKTALDLIENHKNERLITADANQTVAEAIHKMTKFNISQIPVVDNGSFVGSLSDNHLLAQLTENPELKSKKVEEVMQKSFPFVEGTTSMEAVSKMVDKSNAAVLVKMGDGKVHIITKHDIINAIAK
jgi:cystathionine beta-synthase